MWNNSVGPSFYLCYFEFRGLGLEVQGAETPTSHLHKPRPTQKPDS